MSETTLSAEMIIDEAFVAGIVEGFKKRQLLPLSTVFEILERVAKILSKEETLKTIDVSVAVGLTVVGDIHGQFYDLVRIFELNGAPSATNSYLFNGDYVDRGDFSVEVILTLFLYKILFPLNVTLLRGNHESLQLISNYGFSEELETKYKTPPSSENVIDKYYRNNDDEGQNKNHNDVNDVKEAIVRFAVVFRFLPLAALLNDRVFVCHGGLFHRDGVLLSDIRSIDRFREPPEEGLMCDILWSDPQTVDGRRRSRRGLGVAFGPDVTKRFLMANDLDMLVRSHEVKDQGYDVQHEGKCVTIFSAPNYCDSYGNKGAFIIFGEAGDGGSGDGGGGGEENGGVRSTSTCSDPTKLTPRFVQFDAAPHPSIDRRSLSDKLAAMGLVPKSFPF